MKQFLDLICCPETHQPLRLADADLVARINSQIQSGSARNRAGKPVSDPIEGGFVREDGKFLYPIRGNIPAMLIDEALPL